MESYDDWSNTISSALKRGARMERLRLTSTPPTLYERFEIEAGYRAGVLAGEDIRTLPYSEARDQDFWAFDDKYFMSMNYAEDGEFLGFDVLDMTDELLSMVNRWRSRYRQAENRISFD